MNKAYTIGFSHFTRQYGALLQNRDAIIAEMPDCR